MAASRGEFELNAFLPLIADSILGSLGLMRDAVHIFTEKCIRTLSADEARCREQLDGSLAFATSHVPRLGYDKVARIIAEEEGDPGRVRARLESLP
jgi:aspartate ammonia-lyase